MKRTKKMIIAVFMMLVTSAAFAQNPLNESFEGLFPPEGWSVIHKNGSNTWQSYAAIRYDGNKCASVLIDYSGSENYLITPLLKVQNDDSLIFWAAANPSIENTYSFEIKVSQTDNSSENSFDYTLAAVQIPAKWTRFAYSLQQFDGQEIYITFHQNDQGDWFNVYLDMVQGPVALMPECQKPQDFFVLSALQTSVSLIVRDSFAVGSYTVQYTTDDDTLWQNALTLTSTDTLIELNNLEVFRSYKARVKSNCTNSSSQYTSPVYFTTQCQPVSEDYLPWLTDFEDKTMGCWQVTEKFTFDLGFASLDYPYVTNEGCNSDYSAAFGWDKQMICSPVVKGDVSNVVITFKAKVNNLLPEGSHDLYFGVINDIYNPESFEPITPVYALTDWTDNTINLGDYMSYYDFEGKHLAFRLCQTGLLIYQIDDLLIEWQSECPHPESNSVVAYNITDRSAQVCWTDTNDSANQWLVYYKKNDININNSDANVITADTTCITIDNLEFNTEYSVWVKALCDNGISSSAFPFVFATDCKRITEEDLPYSDGFETSSKYDITCWRTVYNTPMFYIPPKEKEYAAYVQNKSNNAQQVFNGEKSLVFSGNSLLAMPMIAADINTIRIKFHYFNNISDSADMLQVGVMSDVEDITTFEPVAQIPKGTLLSQWQDMTVSFENTQIKGENNYIAFKYTTTAYDFDTVNLSFPTSVYAIDDIILEKIAGCQAPVSSSVQITSVTDSSAVVSFEDNDTDHNLWTVYYKDAYSSSYDSITTTEKQVTIDNLNPSSSYSVTIKTLCDDTDLAQDSTDIRYFYTAGNSAVTLLPYSEDFEDLNQIDQWTFLSDTENRWVIGNKVASSSDSDMTNHCLYISNDNGNSNSYNTMKMTKAIAALDVQFGNEVQYTLAFDYKLQGEGSLNNPMDYFSVHLTDQDEDINSPFFLYTAKDTVLSPVVKTNYWQKVFLDLKDVQNTSKKILFMWTNNSFGGENPAVSVDNIEIISSSCIAPSNLKAEALDDEVTIWWDSVADCNGYQIKLNEDGEVYQTDDTSFTFHNLITGKIYTAYVRTRCNSDYSSWRTVVFKAKSPCPEIITEITREFCEGTIFNWYGWLIDEPGIYNFPYTTAEGCDSIVRFTVVQNSPSDTVLNVTVCSNTPYQFGNSSLAISGTYVRKDKNIHGCDSVITLNLTVNPAYDTLIVATVKHGERYTENGFDTDSAGIYTLTLTTQDGCDSVINLRLYWDSGIEDIKDNSSLLIYPNPASEKVTVSLEGITSGCRIFVTDIDGRVIINEYISANESKKEFNLKNLTSGTYIMLITQGNKILKSEKLIKY